MVTVMAKRVRRIEMSDETLKRSGVAVRLRDGIDGQALPSVRSPVAAASARGEVGRLKRAKSGVVLGYSVVREYGVSAQLT